MSAESSPNMFLQNNFAPWGTEGAARDLPVVGRIPRELNGTYYRNGPNPAFPPLGRYHWFDGDGMIHAVTLDDGRASYRNRYVLSRGLREEQEAGRALYRGLLEFQATEIPGFKNTGNTNIVWHAGKLLALVEAALPTRMMAGPLDTVGEYDFDGRLAGPMTAHPKLDPETGEMLFFGYSPFPPYLTYHVAAADGALVRSEVIDVAWPSMMHDFAITKDHVIFILCPLVFSFERLAERGGAFSWEPERGTRLGIMPRRGGNADVRWFDTDPSYVFHPMNAYEDGDAIVLDVARYGRLDFMSAAAVEEPGYRDANAARLHRWRIDLARGGVASTPLDDIVTEFPRVDERRLGRRHRFGYMAAREPELNDGAQPLWTAVRKYDLERGGVTERRFGAGNGVGEPLFVPRTASAGEDDGWVLVLVYDAARDTSDFWILDAQDVAGEPVARVTLPHRVPYGFHGNWVAA
ncbi:MAG: carotenoid oxygenase family protein [Deltaproteobacteria bacterium]|nr:MAG: carotenoid oxygenase family protein [Deltaproteobacteria bacterium]